MNGSLVLDIGRVLALG